jgi:chemotaxis family two-component system response regulator Rcp1
LTPSRSAGSSSYNKPEARAMVINLLMVEDNAGDVRLTMEALKEAQIRAVLHVVHDGLSALKFLTRRPPYTDSPRPDLVLLDLNLPIMDGRELLAEVKQNKTLLQIPVIVLSSSNDAKDVFIAYSLHANCYVTKSATYEGTLEVIRGIEAFWLRLAQLPPGG